MDINEIQEHIRQEFGCLPTLWPADVRSMEDMANFYSRNGSRRERRLASKLSMAVLWIKANARAIELGALEQAQGEGEGE